MRAWITITLVAADQEPPQLDFLIENAAAFLNAHGFNDVAGKKSEKPIEEVLDEETRAGFDLIVAGIHSRKPVKDFFVGSFTEKLIKDGSVPLFLSH